ncbi:MAG: hypothetical protein ABIE55_01945 [Candidatus Aenigmatarchaeota archaeon]
MNIRTAGLIIWKCEGTKRGNKRMVEMCNSDDWIISTFMKFLIKEMKVPKGKIRLRIFLHKDDVENEAKKHWKKITNLKAKNFTKTMWKKRGKWNKKKLLFGTLVIRVHDKNLFNKIKEEAKTL